MSPDVTLSAFFDEPELGSEIEQFVYTNKEGVPPNHL